MNQPPEFLNFFSFINVRTNLDFFRVRVECAGPDPGAAGVSQQETLGSYCW